MLEQALADAEATIAKLAKAANSNTSVDGVTVTKQRIADAWENRNQLFRAVDAERARRGLPNYGTTKIKHISTRFHN